MPGSFEGETVTRRGLFSGRRMAAGGIAGAAIALPAIGFALGPVFDEGDVVWRTVGTVDEFVADNYIPGVVSLVVRPRRGRPDDRLHAQDEPGLSGREARWLRGDLDPLRAPRLSGAAG